jgi:organic radical activating enzyme
MFVSPQGEGAFSGTLMNFIRLAGCSVGKPYPKEIAGKLPIYAAECSTYDGRKFQCDTDFRVKERLDETAIVDWIVLDREFAAQPSRACITGGEPFMHDLVPLFKALQDEGICTHIETSGTVMPSREAFFLADWIVCSPKLGFLPAFATHVNEFKLLVDDSFDWEKVPEVIKSSDAPIYISPINFENEINKDNVKRCLDLQKRHPRLRLTMQLHKILGVR